MGAAFWIRTCHRAAGRYYRKEGEIRQDNIKIVSTSSDLTSSAPSKTALKLGLAFGLGFPFLIDAARCFGGACTGKRLRQLDEISKDLSGF